MNTEWSTPTKQIVGVGLAIFGLYILYISSSVITLVIIAALIAFLLMPIVDFFHHRLKLPRGVAILLAYLLSIIAILLAPLIFIPPIISGFNFLAGIDYQGSENIIESAEIVMLDAEINKELSRLTELERVYGNRTAPSNGSVVQSKDDKIHVNTKTTSQSFSSFTASQQLILFILGIICLSMFGCLTILIFSWIN